MKVSHFFWVNTIKIFILFRSHAGLPIWLLLSARVQRLKCGGHKYESLIFIGMELSPAEKGGSILLYLVPQKNSSTLTWGLCTPRKELYDGLPQLWLTWGWGLSMIYWVGVWDTLGLGDAAVAGLFFRSPINGELYYSEMNIRTKGGGIYSGLNSWDFFLVDFVVLWRTRRSWRRRDHTRTPHFQVETWDRFRSKTIIRLTLIIEVDSALKSATGE